MHAGWERKLEKLKLRVQTACEEQRFLHGDSPARKAGCTFFGAFYLVNIGVAAIYHSSDLVI